MHSGWVDPSTIVSGRSAVGAISTVKNKMARQGMPHHVVTTTTRAFESRDTLDEIDPTFGRWTDVTVYDAAIQRVRRLVAFERAEDAVMYRLILA